MDFSWFGGYCANCTPMFSIFDRRKESSRKIHVLRPSFWDIDDHSFLIKPILTKKLKTQPNKHTFLYKVSNTIFLQSFHIRPPVVYGPALNLVVYLLRCLTAFNILWPAEKRNKYSSQFKKIVPSKTLDTIT